jgi:hypothetical protein
MSTVRNKLVHDHNFNALDSRTEFAKSFDLVEKELKAKIIERRGGAGGACVVM